MDYSKAIFVFGSNEGGYHGAGAAAFARRRKGAILHKAEGLQGQSYAIPTKDKTIRNTLSIYAIRTYVDRFLMFAREHPELEFQVTRIGCGLAGLKDEDIAPLFQGAPNNCWFDNMWFPYLTTGAGDRPEHKFWGTF